MHPAFNAKKRQTSGPGESLCGWHAYANSKNASTQTLATGNEWAAAKKKKQRQRKTSGISLDVQHCQCKLDYLKET